MSVLQREYIGARCSLLEAFLVLVNMEWWDKSYYNIV